MIPFQVPDEGHVKISILNMLGQEIQILVNERKNEGYHEVVWNGRDGANNIVGSGKYLLHMVAGVYRQTRKILFVR